MKEKARLMDKHGLEKTLTRMAHEIIEHHSNSSVPGASGIADLRLVGIRTRGVPIARRLAACLKDITGADVPTGLGNHLDQALANLVHNGVKYSRPEGTVTMRLSVAPELGGADAVKVKIEDQGIGIERRHLPRIFERFYTVERVVGEQASVGGAGTGLGLAIARHAILRHGGSIEVDSEEGRGSAFTLVFPGAVVRSEDGRRAA